MKKNKITKSILKVDEHTSPTLLTLFIIIFFNFPSFAQEVPIINYSIDTYGQVQLEFNSDIDHYYILKVQHENIGSFELATSMTLGKPGTTLLTEPLASYPLEQYQVNE